MCRCAERRLALRTAVAAAAHADFSRIVPASKFVVATSAEDLAAVFRRGVSLAKAMGR